MHSTFGTVPTISEKDAAGLLVTESALGDLEFKDALRIVAYMRPKRIKEGAVFIREGEKTHNDFMMLMLYGEARVETQMQGAAEPVTMAVLSAGHLVGEIGAINGDPRSATCVAITELAVGVITRQALSK
ncbi:MAG: cyclic nucleotide-binding domain-containing protein [Brachymonas sp.]|nr:cyclic nucleotide-binding domain-containing protein [Brachymonas sp.]